MTREAGQESRLAVLRGRAAAIPRRIGFPEASEHRTRDAILRLARAGLVRPVALGDSERMSELFGEWPQVERIRVEGDPAARSPLAAAADLLAGGELDGVVAGAVNTTADVLRAGLRRVGLAEGITTVSSAFYMILRRPTPAGVDVLLFTDPAVVPTPSPDQMAESAELASRARRLVVGDEPRVAFLSYSTRGSSAGEEVMKVRRALELFRERCPDVSADGELQADAALVPEVARRKAPGSQIAGDANVLVFPDLNAANIAYKLVERLAGARALGPILQGLAHPLNDLSRGADVTDVVHVACITALMSAARAGPPEARERPERHHVRESGAEPDLETRTGEGT